MDLPVCAYDVRVRQPARVGPHGPGGRQRTGGSLVKSSAMRRALGQLEAVAAQMVANEVVGEMIHAHLHSHDRVRQDIDPPTLKD